MRNPLLFFSLLVGVEDRNRLEGCYRGNSMLINKVLLSIGVKNDCIVVESLHHALELEPLVDVDSTGILSFLAWFRKTSCKLMSFAIINHLFFLCSQ